MKYVEGYNKRINKEKDSKKDMVMKHIKGNNKRLN